MCPLIDAMRLQLEMRTAYHAKFASCSLLPCWLVHELDDAEGSLEHCKPWCLSCTLLLQECTPCTRSTMLCLGTRALGAGHDSMQKLPGAGSDT